MALLSLESNVVARVGYGTSSRFTEKVYLRDVDSDGSVGAGGTILKTDRIAMNANAGDVGTPAAGDLWYNATSGKLKYYHGGTAYTMLDSGGGTMGGHLLFSPTNNYDIGASAGTKPRSIYAGTDIYQGANKVLDAATAHVGDVTGTNGVTVVERVRGYTVENHAPATGESLLYTGAQYSPGAVFGSLDKYVDYSGASSGNITGLSGKLIKVFFFGRWVGGGSGGQGIFWIRPNNYSTNDYVFASHQSGNDNANWIHNVGSYGIGFPLSYFPVAETPSGWNCEDSMAEITIRAFGDTGNVYTLIESRWLGRDGSGGTSVIYHQLNSGSNKDTNNVTSVYWQTTRGTFTGRMVVFTYVG